MAPFAGDSVASVMDLTVYHHASAHACPENNAVSGRALITSVTCGWKLAIVH